MQIRSLITIAILATLLAHKPAPAQVLDLIRTFVRTPDVDDSSDPTNDCSGFQSRSDDEDDGFFDTLGTLVFTSPYWAPRMLVGDEGGQVDFESVPYIWDMNSEWGAGQNPEQIWAWSTQFSIDYVGDFDDLSAIGGRWIVETRSRFGIDTTFRFYEEDRGIGPSDNLTIGDANLVFRFAQGERLRMRSGIGFNWLNDEVESDFGFNFTYGGDWFPSQPWIVSTDLDLGRLGSASLVHFRATLGRQFHQAELFIGYDVLRVRNVTADGLLAGIRWWF